MQAIRGTTTLALSTALAAGAIVAVAPLPATAAEAATTFLTVVQAPFTPDTPYMPTQVFRPDNATISLTGSTSQVSVSASGPSGSASLVLQGAPGQTLAPGTYDDDGSTVELFNVPYCSAPGDGDFVVRDIAFDDQGVPTRFWGTWEYRCSAWPTTNFGELRYNEPGGDSDLLVANDTIDWPDTYPGVAGPNSRVWLTNTGSSPVTISGATIGGDNPGDFGIVSNGCTTLAVGATCYATVRFLPTTSGPRAATLTFADTTAAGSHTVSLNGTGIGGHTIFSLRSEAGDPIGKGGSYDFTPANAKLWAWSSDDEHFTLQVSGGAGIGWGLALNSPQGSPLVPGTYDNATITDVAGRPGLEAFAGSRCDSTYAASFTVVEAAYDEFGDVQRFAATFTERCTGAKGALHGWVAWRATDALAPDDTAPAAVSHLTAYPEESSLFLTWDIPAVSDFAGVVVRGAEGLYAPTSPTAGFAVYTGPGDSVYLSALDPGQSYAFSVFARDTSLNVSTPAKVAVRGSDLVVTATPGTITFGSASKVTLTLRDGYTRAYLVERYVDVYVRRHGSTAFKYLGTALTGYQGNADIALKAPSNYDVKVVFWGGGKYVGSTAGPITVYVRPLVTAALSRTSVVRNDYATLSGKVSPTHAGQVVYLQRYYSGAWHNVASKTLSSTSTYAFSLHPTSVGSWVYRVYKPADSDHVRSYSPTRTLTAT